MKPELEKFLAEQPLAQKAYDFAKAHFEAEDVRRRYTNEPYMTHPVRVAEIMLGWGLHHSAAFSEDQVIAAALLHDTVEDTAVTLDDIHREFGPQVATLVEAVTDISSSRASQGASRKERKALDLAHLAAAPRAAQDIKLADIRDNTVSILRYDPVFACQVYLPEKRETLKALTKADPDIRDFILGEIASGVRDNVVQTFCDTYRAKRLPQSEVARAEHFLKKVMSLLFNV